MEMIEEKLNTIITIDPGVNGGYAVQTLYDEYGNKSKEIAVFKMQTDFEELCKSFLFYDSAVAYIENQQLRKTDFFNNTWFNIHKLCIHTETIKNALRCTGIKVIDLDAKKWQKLYFLQSRTYKDRKKELKEKAKRIFHDHKVTAWNCDCLLMLNYINKTNG